MAQDVARTEEKPAVHPVDQLLPVPKLAVYGFQHVLAFYAGAVIVPILLGSAIDLTPEQLGYLINADLFTCGIASIIQTIGFWKIGVRLPLLQGVTFAAVSPMISIGLAEGGGVPGLRAIFGAVIIAGIVTFVVAPFFANLIRLFPPVVTGTVITIIGVVLLSVAALDAGGGGASQFTEPPTFGALRNLALAGFTLVFILALYRFFKGFVATIAVLIGLVVGTAVGAIFGFTDFSRVADAPWFGVTTPFHFGAPTFNAAAIIAMVIVMLITMVETTGDVFACADIVEKPVDKTDVARALRADGLATTLGGILNSFPYTCFAENVGLVRLTKVKSRYVVATAGLFMMIIGIFPKVGAAVAAIPPPVLGGAAYRALRHRCRGRDPDPAPGGLPRRAQRHHPGDQPGHGDHADGLPNDLYGVPPRRTNDHQQRHHHGQHHRDPAEPDLQRLGWQEQPGDQSASHPAA